MRTRLTTSCTKLLVTALLVLPQALFAQTEGQSILSYKMQGRYRPEGAPFVNNNLGDNLFISLYGGYFRPFADNFSSGTSAGIAIEKWIRPAHGVRLEVGSSWFTENYNASNVRMIDFRLSYLFDVDAYLDGFNPSRPFQIRPIAGLGYSLVHNSDNPSGGAFSAHMGLNLSMNIFKGMYLYAEPRIEIQKDALSLARMDLWRGYVFNLRGNVGLGVVLDRNDRNTDMGQDWFVSLSGAAQIQYSNLLKTHNELITNIGPAATLAFGRHYPRGWAWRAAITAGKHSWSQTEGGVKLPSMYAGFRLEAMYDIIAAIGKESRLATSVFVGPEFGFMRKEDVDLIIKYQYTGLSCGVHIKFRIIPRLSVFLEPRISFIPYSAISYNHVSTNQNYYDGLVNVGLGVEYCL